MGTQPVFPILLRALVSPGILGPSLSPLRPSRAITSEPKPLHMAFSGHEGFGPKLPQGTLPVREDRGAEPPSPTKAFLAFFLFLFFLPSWF